MAAVSATSGLAATKPVRSMQSFTPAPDGDADIELDFSRVKVPDVPNVEV